MLKIENTSDGYEVTKHDMNLSNSICENNLLLVKLEQLPCEQFLQAFEIYRALLHAKQRAKIQNPVKIAHKAVVLILLSL